MNSKKLVLAALSLLMTAQTCAMQEKAMSDKKFAKFDKAIQTSLPPEIRLRIYEFWLGRMRWKKFDDTWLRWSFWDGSPHMLQQVGGMHVSLPKEHYERFNSVGTMTIPLGVGEVKLHISSTDIRYYSIPPVAGATSGIYYWEYLFEIACACQKRRELILQRSFERGSKIGPEKVSLHSLSATTDVLSNLATLRKIPVAALIRTMQKTERKKQKAERKQGRKKQKRKKKQVHAAYEKK